MNEFYRHEPARHFQSLLFKAFRLLIVFSVGALLPASISAADAKKSSRADSAERKFIEQVFIKLLAGLKPGEFPAEYSYPPLLLTADDHLVEIGQSPKQVQAFSSIIAQGDLEKFEGSQIVLGNSAEAPQTGDKIPFVGVSHPLMEEIVQNDSDRLAFVLAHELGHVLGKHAVSPHAGEETRTGLFLRRTDELEADRIGMELILRAGFSGKLGFKAYQLMREYETAEGRKFSSFEGFAESHPSWAERLASLDQARTKLWRAMSSFENGVYFLKAEHFQLASAAFEEVVGEFPQSFEGWNNLGYARLMHYADKLIVEDLTALDLGFLLTGGFYDRAGSIDPKDKGFDVQLWNRAVEAFDKALLSAGRQKRNIALIKANLGVAYLIRPPSIGGQDSAQAAKYLNEAYTIGGGSNAFSWRERSFIINNSIVADIANRRYASAKTKLAVLKKAYQTNARAETGITVIAEQFNRSLIELRSARTESARRRAKTALCGAADKIPDNSFWYQATVAKYECAPQPKTAVFKRAVSLELQPGLTVSLGEKKVELVTRLNSEALNFVQVSTNDGKILKLIIPAKSTDIIVTDEGVLAIVVRSRDLPKLKLELKGGGDAKYLSVGMERKSIEDILGQLSSRETLIDRNYNFYSASGVALHYSKNPAATGGADDGAAGEIVDEIVVLPGVGF